MHIYIYIYLYIRTHTHIYVYIYIYIYICIYMYAHACVNILTGQEFGAYVYGNPTAHCAQARLIVYTPDTLLYGD